MDKSKDANKRIVGCSEFCLGCVGKYFLREIIFLCGIKLPNHERAFWLMAELGLILHRTQHPQHRSSGPSGGGWRWDSGHRAKRHLELNGGERLLVVSVKKVAVLLFRLALRVHSTAVGKTWSWKNEAIPHIIYVLFCKHFMCIARFLRPVGSARARAVQHEHEHYIIVSCCRL